MPDWSRSPVRWVEKPRDSAVASVKVDGLGLPESDLIWFKCGQIVGKSDALTLARLRRRRSDNQRIKWSGPAEFVASGC